MDNYYYNQFKIRYIRESLMESTGVENSKLTKLRELLKENGVDAYLVFHGDAHSVSLAAP